MVVDSPENEAAVLRRERLILLILAAVQFTTIVDFMIVMPLGPDLRETLHITPEQFGWVVSSYSFAAGVAGLLAATIVDRFARRTTFMVLNGGFLLGTLFCAFAPTYEALVAARVATGAFGGILGGITMTIIGDVFPEHRRGRATGSLMAGFAVASVLGVPFGLVLGTYFSWHVPFIALVIGGLPALLLTPLALPPLNAHVNQQHAPPLRKLWETFSHANHLAAFALIVSLMLGSFSVFPYLSDYYVKNVGFKESQLPLMYVCGGILTLMVSPRVGWLADHYGKLKVFRMVAPATAVLLLLITHLPPVHVSVGVALFGVMMACNVSRMIPAMALVTSSVQPRLRGGFLSVNSSVQHIASGLGAYIGGKLIVETADNHLQNFGLVGWIAAAFTLLSLWLAGRILIVTEQGPSAEELSLAAAAEATAGEGESLESAKEDGIWSLH